MRHTLKQDLLTMRLTLFIIFYSSLVHATDHNVSHASSISYEERVSYDDHMIGYSKDYGLCGYFLTSLDPEFRTHSSRINRNFITLKAEYKQDQVGPLTDDPDLSHQERPAASVAYTSKLLAKKDAFIQNHLNFSERKKIYTSIQEELKKENIILFLHHKNPNIRIDLKNYLIDHVIQTDLIASANLGENDLRQMPTLSGYHLLNTFNDIDKETILIYKSQDILCDSSKQNEFHDGNFAYKITLIELINKTKKEGSEFISPFKIYSLLKTRAFRFLIPAISGYTWREASPELALTIINEDLSKIITTSRTST